eukprot:11848292-Alexandrium_andersonii.AAC.1
MVNATPHELKRSVGVGECVSTPMKRRDSRTASRTQQVRKAAHLSRMAPTGVRGQQSRCSARTSPTPRAGKVPGAGSQLRASPRAR